MPPRTLIHFATPLLVAAMATGAGWDNPIETAVHRELDRAVTPQPGNGHLPRLSALRALHDDRLIPLLISLIDDDDPAIQVHAMLGLAELRDDGRLDPERMLTADPVAFDSILAIGLEADRLNVDDMQTLLSHASPSAQARLWLLGALIESGAMVEPATVAAIQTESDPHAAARQAAQLAYLGSPDSLRTMTESLAQDPEQIDLLDAAMEAMAQIRKLPSDDGMDLARACLRDSSPDGVRRYALLTLLEQRTSDSEQLFCKELASTSRRRHLVDLSLLLLMTGTPTPDACRVQLEQDALLATLSRAAIALADKPLMAGTALQGLVDSGHRRTIAWVLEHSHEWEQDIAVPLLEGILDATVATGLNSTSAAHGVASAALLLERAPNVFRQRLNKAEDDGAEQRLLLVALLQQPAPALADAVTSIRRIGIGQADVLALLVHARDREAIAPEDVASLKLIAASSSSSEAIRTQAAWLAVRHSGLIDDVVASLVKPPR
ncbi:MAG: hypothetical protein GY894_00310 [Planctomycetes bacterium]|jgi:hypothetical protein|nr:hypothetical protein [Planctomycetota bacterium]MCP4837790.1 hypothetical protein [Planctomycetota bacterium]